jgi:hypothetical protein
VQAEPQNQKSENKNKHIDNNQNRNGYRTGNNRCTERHGRNPSRESSREHNRHCSSRKSRRKSSDSKSDNKYHYINHHSDKNKRNENKTPSSEILVAKPDKKGSKKYTTYLGLIDSGASGSLVNKELVEFADFGKRNLQNGTQLMASFKQVVQSLLKATTYLNFLGSKKTPLPCTCNTKKLQTDTKLFSAAVFSQTLALLDIAVTGPKRKFLNLPKHGIPSTS